MGTIDVVAILGAAVLEGTGQEADAGVPAAHPCPGTATRNAGTRPTRFEDCRLQEQTAAVLSDLTTYSMQLYCPAWTPLRTLQCLAGATTSLPGLAISIHDR